MNFGFLVLGFAEPRERDEKTLLGNKIIREQKQRDGSRISQFRERKYKFKRERERGGGGGEIESQTPRNDGGGRRRKRRQSGRPN